MMPLAAAALAMGYAAAGTAALAGAGWATGRGPGPRGLSLLFATLLFVTLTQLPLPETGRLECPVPGADPILHPFDIVRRMVERWSISNDLAQWVREVGFLDAAMNLALCAVIGALLALYPLRMGSILAIGFAASLAAETTQITALWGLYPCPYRVFDVNDLLHNTVGVALGAAWMRRRDRPALRPPARTTRTRPAPGRSPPR